MSAADGRLRRQMAEAEQAWFGHVSACAACQSGDARCEVELELGRAADQALLAFFEPVDGSGGKPWREEDVA